MTPKSVIYGAVSVILLLSACSSTKRVNLDPVSVSANAAGVNIYRASYTKSVDQWELAGLILVVFQSLRFLPD